MTDAPIAPQIALGNFRSLRPEIEMTQEESLDYIARAHTAHGEPGVCDSVPTYLRRFGVKPQQIATRGFENLELPMANASLQERTEFFLKRSLDRFREFYSGVAIAPSHMIHVTCTGYVSPSAPQRLVNERGWNSQTNVTHAYHMGCYAAMPAIRMAEGFVAAQKKPVDIVHTELCGLHLDARQSAPEQLVVQTLFADGHIKYTAARPEEFEHGFRVLKVKEKIVSDSFQDMSWIPSSQSMHMTLSREVPSKIGVELRKFLVELSDGHDLSSLLKNAQFAVHPGGPKIIDAVRETLELSESQVATSREILRTHGNMSSATLPHVWKQMLTEKVRGPVVSLAFGPGLTIFGAVFEAF